MEKSFGYLNFRLIFGLKSNYNIPVRTELLIPKEKVFVRRKVLRKGTIFKDYLHIGSWNEITLYQELSPCGRFKVEK